MANRERKKLNKGEEINMIPFVNFMVSIIPVLIVSVEFAKISIIDMKLPEGRGSQTQSTVKERPQQDEENKLLLTAIVTDSVVTLGAKGGFLPSLFYREYHEYSARDDKANFTVEYKPGVVPKHPKSNREMTVYERLNVFLYVCDENRNLIKCLYTPKGEMLSDGGGNALQTAKPGDTVYTVANPRRMIVLNNPDAECKLLPLSAYDELRNKLLKVKQRFQEADDINDIIIAAENEVLYDKIVQLMDVARAADFPNISIAKLRG